MWASMDKDFFKFQKRDFYFYTEINVKVSNEE